MDGNSKVNQLYDDIRTLLKLPHSKERGEKVLAIVKELAENYENAMMNSKDIEFMNVAHFAGFSAMALMYGAVKDDEDPANMMAYVAQVISICTGAMTSREAEHGSDA